MLIDAPIYTSPVAPLETREATDAEVLLHAVTVLERDGWSGSSWRASDGRLCILGAIGQAAIELGRYDASREPHRSLAVQNASSKIVSVFSERDRLIRWNDQSMNHIGHVKKKLLEMARLRS